MMNVMFQNIVLQRIRFIIAEAHQRGFHHRHHGFVRPARPCHGQGSANESQQRMMGGGASAIREKWNSMLGETPGDQFPIFICCRISTAASLRYLRPGLDLSDTNALIHRAAASTSERRSGVCTI